MASTQASSRLNPGYTKNMHMGGSASQTLANGRLRKS